MLRDMRTLAPRLSLRSENPTFPPLIRWPRYAFAFGAAGQVKFPAAVAAIGAEPIIRLPGDADRILFGGIALFPGADALSGAHGGGVSLLSAAVMLAKSVRCYSSEGRSRDNRKQRV